MNDLIILIPFAAVCVGVIYMAFALDRQTPRRRRFDRAGEIIVNR